MIHFSRDRRYGRKVTDIVEVSSGELHPVFVFDVELARIGGRGRRALRACDQNALAIAGRSLVLLAVLNLTADLRSAD